MYKVVILNKLVVVVIGSLCEGLSQVHPTSLLPTINLFPKKTAKAELFSIAERGEGEIGVVVTSSLLMKSFAHAPMLHSLTS